MEQVLLALGDWHEQRPESPGPDEKNLARSLECAVPRDLFRSLVDDLISSGKMMRDGLALHLPTHRARLTEAETVLWQRIEPVLEEGGLRPPRVQEIADTLDVNALTLEAIFGRAVVVGLAHPISHNRYFTPKTVLELAHIAETLANETTEGTFDAARFRDRSGIGRNLAIEVLEFFDRCGFTTRQSNVRRILKSASQTFRAPIN